MWDSGKRLVNASVPWYGGRCARHLGGLAQLARFATSPCVQASRTQVSYDFFTSYSLKFEPMRRTPRRRSQPSNDTESASKDNTYTSDVTEQTIDFNRSRAPSESSINEHLRELLREAESRHAFKSPGPRDDKTTPRHQSDHHGQEGHSSGSESITILFEPNWSDPLGREFQLPKLYLRDICQCSRCVCPSTGLKNFATCDIPDVPRVRTPELNTVRLLGRDPLEITWEDDFLTGDDHTSVYSQEFLESLETTQTQSNYNPRPLQVLWDKGKFQKGMESRAITYHDWMDEGPEFAKAMSNLHAYGLLFMRDVPRSWYSVVRIGARLGNLQHTAHGMTWDDVSEPSAENDASGDVRLHQDLLYSNDQPQIQFAHCLENDFPGHVFSFSDGLNSAWNVRRRDKVAYSTLSTQLVDYNYRKEGQFLLARRRVIQPRKKGGNPGSISWSPASQGPFHINEHKDVTGLERYSLGKGPANGELRDWTRAARIFRNEVESPSNVIKCQLQPGDCVIFDNRRVLWGSKRLSMPSGRKHLRVAFVETQTLSSAFVRLIEKGLLQKETVRPPVPSIFD